VREGGGCSLYNTEEFGSSQAFLLDNCRTIRYYAGMSTVQELINALQRKGWTIAALSDEIGASRDSIENWRKGRNPAHPKVIAETLERLLTQEDVPGRRRDKKRPPPPTD
jgi:lambda repressor-like predicted transcriptional regulator